MHASFLINSPTSIFIFNFLNSIPFFDFSNIILFDPVMKYRLASILGNSTAARERCQGMIFQELSLC